jgi:hypothetical protein
MKMINLSEEREELKKLRIKINNHKKNLSLTYGDFRNDIDRIDAKIVDIFGLMDHLEREL